MGLIAMPGIISNKRLLVWAPASSPGFGSTLIRSVRYDGTYWVATAQSGKIRYATDPTGTWTSASSPGFGGGEDIIKVDYGDDDGNWVAVSLSSNTRTTTDPTGTWNFVSEGLASSLDCVRRGAGQWVIGDGGSDFAYVADPLGAWSQNNDQFGGKQILNVYRGSTYWVAVGQDIQVRTTTNPAGTWVFRATPFTGGEDIYGVFYSTEQGIWVVTGKAGKIITAVDPTGTWTLNSSNPFIATDVIYDVWYGGGRWVAVTSSGKIATAVDPTGEWTLSPNSFGGTTIWGVSYGSDGNWVAVGSSGLIIVGR